MYLGLFSAVLALERFYKYSPPSFLPPLLREDSAEEAAVKPLQRPGGAGVGGGGDLHLMD